MKVNLRGVGKKEQRQFNQLIQKQAKEGRETLKEVEARTVLAARARPTAGRVGQGGLGRTAGRIAPAGGQLPPGIVVALRAVRRRDPSERAGDPRAERDALIAATALVHGMTVVTRNVADFEPTGVPTVNPWQIEKA